MDQTNRMSTQNPFVPLIFGLMLVQYAYLAAIKYTNAGTGTAMQYLGETFPWSFFWQCRG